MSFNTALSGLNAASADLNVKSNNIANVNTTGFKQSRAEFADVYAVSAFGSSNTTIGSGTELTNVAQQFKQGNVQSTDNSLDLMVRGQGFFALAPNQTSSEVVYSRAGAFGINKDGFVVNSSGQFLRTFPVNTDGTVSSTSMSSTSPLQLPSSAGVPSATTTANIAANISAGDAIPSVTPFDPANPLSFNNSTSVTVYDSLGDQQILSLFYVKTAPNTWDVNVTTSDAGATPGATTSMQLTFNPANGSLTSAPPSFTYDLSTLTSGANNLSVSLDFTGTTQFSAPFAVTQLSQDGFTTGRLSGLDIGEDGLVRATFTNGQSEALGKIALATFPNSQGLKQIGNTSWLETQDSGSVRAGEAGSGSYGSIKSGALEASNVDLTKELVGLITAQRNFQANSKSIETENAITQTIINLR